MILKLKIFYYIDIIFGTKLTPDSTVH